MKNFKKLVTALLVMSLLFTLAVFPMAAEDDSLIDSVTSSDEQDLKGDINDDRAVNSSDALLVLKHAVKSMELTGKALEKADVNKDNSINASDALIILRIAVGIEDEDPKPSGKEDIVALYNTSIINSYEQDKIVLEGFTEFDAKLNKLLIDGKEDKEMTEMFEEILNSMEYEDVKLTFINGETEDGIRAEDGLSTLEVSADDVETATVVPHGDGYKLTLKLYPMSETLTGDDLAASGYESYKMETSKIEIIAVTDGQGRLMLLDYYTYANVKATAVEEGVKMSMDFDIEQRDVMSFTY
ncbi:MAG: dockerin type I repeat-containing protein [Clostridia bacterium]|nr:dockerin type I repeat-containing protein [Clostridia bacterium]